MPRKFTPAQAVVEQPGVIWRLIDHRWYRCCQPDYESLSQAAASRRRVAENYGHEYWDWLEAVLADPRKLPASISIGEPPRVH